MDKSWHHVVGLDNRLKLISARRTDCKMVPELIARQGPDADDHPLGCSVAVPAG